MGKVINVEIQILKMKELAERVLFYTSKMITAQIDARQKYNVIKKVISILILDYSIITDSDKYCHSLMLRDVNTNIKFTDMLEIHTFELQKLPALSDNSKLYDWLSFIKSQDEEALNMLATKNPEIKKAVGQLKVLSQDERTRLQAESREKALRDEWSRIDYATDEGKEIGLKQGIEEGLKQGIERGIELANMETAKKLIARKMSIEEIIEVTNLTEEQIKSLM